MSSITLDQADAQLNAWLTASLAVAEGQTISMQGYSLSLADLGQINDQIIFWEKKCKALGRVGGAISVKSVIPA